MEVSQRHKANRERTLSESEARLQQQLQEEVRVSERIEEYLKKHYQNLAVKVDFWMTKHENDLDMKTKDLHELKVLLVHVLCETCLAPAPLRPQQTWSSLGGTLCTAVIVTP